MDLQIKAAYINFNDDEPKMVVRNDNVAIEETSGGYITFQAEDIEDTNELLQDLFSEIDSTADFLRSLGEHEENIRDHYMDDVEEPEYTAQKIISEWDGEFEEFKEFGKLLRDDYNMEGELKSLIKAIGLEKIQEIFNIKMVIYNQESDND